MRISDTSARSLLWFAILLLLPGMLIMSPTGRLFFVVVAALVALVPVIFGSTRRRVSGAVVVALCLVIGIPTYSEHQKVPDLRTAAGARYARDVTTWLAIDVPAESDPAIRAIWFSAANRSAHTWQVSAQDAGVRAELVDGMPEPSGPRPSFTPTAGQLQYVSAYATVDDGWLVGFNQGEFGAALYWFSADGKQSYKISDHQVVAFFVRSDGIHAIQGLAHLGLSNGSVIRITRAKTGTQWQASTVTALPAAPYAVSTLRDGAAVITLSDSLVAFTADRKLRPLLAKAPWGALFPNSSVFTPDEQKLYIGMRQYVGEFDLKTKQLRLLVPSRLFVNKLPNDEQDRIREQHK